MCQNIALQVAGPVLQNTKRLYECLKAELAQTITRASFTKLPAVKSEHAVGHEILLSHVLTNKKEKICFSL